MDRLIMKYDSTTGEILSVMKLVESDGPGPQVAIVTSDNESLLELESAGAYAELEPIVLHNRFRVDVRRKRLVERSD